jgi:SAM-dependent methyltransferase
MNTIQENPFEPISHEYDQWFDDNRNTFLSELEAIRLFTPKSGNGLEIGVGTGRFAMELGIKTGIEPSAKMAQFAINRGIEVHIGKAENLPYESKSFDFAIMVAVDPFVHDIGKVYQEINRVLKDNGKLIVGTLHKDGLVAQKYMNMTDSEVYKNAHFHTVNETLAQLKRSGFNTFNICQTLFSLNVTEVEQPVSGFDKGSFIAIESQK